MKPSNAPGFTSSHLYELNRLVLNLGKELPSGPFGRLGESSSIRPSCVTIDGNTACIDVPNSVDVSWKADRAGSSKSRDFSAGPKHLAGAYESHTGISPSQRAIEANSAPALTGAYLRNSRPFAIHRKDLENLIEVVEIMKNRADKASDRFPNEPGKNLPNSVILENIRYYLTKEKNKAGQDKIKVTIPDIRNTIGENHPDLYDLEYGSANYHRLDNVMQRMKTQYHKMGYLEADGVREYHNQYNIRIDDFKRAIAEEREKTGEVSEKTFPTSVTEAMLKDTECPPRCQDDKNRNVLINSLTRRRKFVFDQYQAILGRDFEGEEETKLTHQCANAEKKLKEPGRPQSSSTAKKVGELGFAQIGSVGRSVDIFVPPQSTVSRGSEAQLSIFQPSKMPRLDAASFSTEATETTSVTGKKETEKPYERGERLAATLKKLKSIAAQQSAETPETSNAPKRTNNSDVQSSRSQAVAESHQRLQKSQQELEEAYRKARAEQSRGNPDEAEDESVKRSSKKANTSSKLHAN